jgi:hypothetical protein
MANLLTYSSHVHSTAQKFTKIIIQTWSKHVRLHEGMDSVVIQPINCQVAFKRVFVYYDEEICEIR